METGNCRVQIDKTGSDAPVRNVTPAEVMILREMHQPNVGKDPISGLAATANVTRSGAQEKLRLRSKYPSKLIEGMFPGVTPSLPATFAEIPSGAVEAEADVEMDKGSPKLSEPSNAPKPLAGLEKELAAKDEDDIDSIIAGFNDTHEIDDVIALPTSATKEDKILAILVAGAYTPAKS